MAAAAIKTTKIRLGTGVLIPSARHRPHTCSDGYPPGRSTGLGCAGYRAALCLSGIYPRFRASEDGGYDLDAPVAGDPHKLQARTTRRE
jgi:hypothetical protein